MKKTELFLFNNISYGIDRLAALHDLSMVLFREEITGILYENSASGEALLELFSGNGYLENGTLRYYGKKLLDLKDLKKDYYIIGPAPNVISTLSIIDNVFFSKYSFGIFSRRKYQVQLQKLYYLFDITIPFQKTIEALNEVQRIQIELLIAYVSKKQYVILNQFSAMFSEEEMEELIPVIMKLHKLGITIIVVDRYERFIYRITDKVYIMRNGTAVDMLEGSVLNEYTVTKIFSPYIRLGEAAASEEKQMTGKVLMRGVNIETRMIKKLDFEIHQGEIWKLYYTRRKLAEEFCGLFTGRTQLLSGEVSWIGKKGSAEKNRLGIIYADSVHKLLFTNQTVEFNLMYPVMKKTTKILWSKKYLDYIKKMLSEELPEEIYKKKVDEISYDMKMSLICAKWYLYRPRILLFAKPFPSFYYEGDKLMEHWIKKMVSQGISVIALDSNWPSYIELPGKTDNLDRCGNV